MSRMAVLTLANVQQGDGFRKGSTHPTILRALAHLGHRVAECTSASGKFMKSNGALDAEGRPPLAIDSLLVRPEARLPHLPD